jgi:hypothetical protein
MLVVGGGIAAGRGHDFHFFSHKCALSLIH